jgi:hypothetical protein
MSVLCLHLRLCVYECADFIHTYTCALARNWTSARCSVCKETDIDRHSPGMADTCIHTYFHVHIQMLPSICTHVYVHTYVFTYIHDTQLEFRKTLEMERDRHRTEMEVTNQQREAERQTLHADRGSLEQQILQERSERERGLDRERALERERDNARTERDILERQIFADREVLEEQIKRERAERERLHKELKAALSARETGRRNSEQAAAPVSGVSPSVSARSGGSVGGDVAHARFDEGIRVVEEEVLKLDKVLRVLRAEVVKNGSRCARAQVVAGMRVCVVCVCCVCMRDSCVFSCPCACACFDRIFGLPCRKACSMHCSVAACHVAYITTLLVCNNTRTTNSTYVYCIAYKTTHIAYSTIRIAHGTMHIAYTIVCMAYNTYVSTHNAMHIAYNTMRISCNIYSYRLPYWTYNVIFRVHDSHTR